MSEQAASSSPSNLPPGVIPPPPAPGPKPTGNLAHDVYQSVTHIGEVPCARNSLLSGIASGVGIGVIRGLSASPMVAGHWAMATFAVISIGSWHLCHKQMDDERKKVTKIIGSMPKRVVKEAEESTGGSSAQTKS
ncbi:hypothetical protein AX16_008029 [Volvariella volvacea WC 439]|nr:hypothetical protein AX16_008029 [Volvariella volvacea WC 439]